MAGGGIVHDAGPMVANVQRCTRCGFVIADYRNACWVGGSEDGPKAWALGPVTVDESPLGGRCTFTGDLVGAVPCERTGGVN